MSVWSRGIRTKDWRAMATILIVDDEQNLVDLVQSYLAKEGFSILVARDGLHALEMARTYAPDLVVLDVMLPGLDGVEVCRRLRSFSDAYVLMLTAKAEEIDKIVGLSVGADSYMTKPFSPRELVAQVRAMLRRRSMGSSPDPDAALPRRFGDLVLDEQRHEVTCRGVLVPLTAREFQVLAILASHPRRMFTRPQLLERVWGDEYYDDHVVDVHVGNLRKKIEDDPAHPRFIETVRGVGYRFAARTE